MKNEISKFRDAIIYSVNQEIPLRNFVLDVRLECSNNKCERSIKPLVIARKTFFFVTHHQAQMLLQLHLV